MSTDIFSALATETLERDEGAPDGLHAPNSSAPAGIYIRRIWQLRHFIVESARARMASKNYDTWFGNFWLVLEPMMFVGVYYTLFTVAGITRGLDNFILFLVVGRFAFGHHRTAVGGAASALRMSSSLLQNTNMPRAVAPVTSVVAALYDFLASAGAIFVVAFATGEYPRLWWLAFIPLVIGQIVLNMGVSLLVAQAAARLRDVQNAVPVVMRILFYSSGVIFPVESYVEDSAQPDLWYGLLMLNPFYGYIKGFQYAIVGFDAGRPGLAVLSSIAWTLVLLPLGFWWFLRNERRFGSVRFSDG